MGNFLVGPRMLHTRCLHTRMLLHTCPALGVSTIRQSMQCAPCIIKADLWARKRCNMFQNQGAQNQCLAAKNRILTSTKHLRKESINNSQEICVITHLKLVLHHNNKWHSVARSSHGATWLSPVPHHLPRLPKAPSSPLSQPHSHTSSVAATPSHRSPCSPNDLSLTAQVS